MTNIDLTFNKVIAKILKLFHIIFTIILLIGPYITDNYDHIVIFILLHICLIIQWLLYKQCILTDIEYILEGDKIKNIITE